MFILLSIFSVIVSKTYFQMLKNIAVQINKLIKNNCALFPLYLKQCELRLYFLISYKSSSLLTFYCILGSRLVQCSIHFNYYYYFLILFKKKLKLGDFYRDPEPRVPQKCQVCQFAHSITLVGQSER